MHDKNERDPSEAPEEFEGKTIEHAIKAACSHFGMPENELEIEILTKGSTGIFGLGGRKAKVRVSPHRLVATVQAQPEEEPAAPQESPLQVQGPLLPAAETTEPAALERTAAPISEDQLAAAKEIAVNVCRLAAFDVQVQESVRDGKGFLELTGEDVSLAIGKEGQTLDALEYIVNRILTRRISTSPTIALDAQDYRDKRGKKLARLAMKMADQAQKRGRSVALEPMSPKDRRLIHLTLKNVSGIRTRSVGEGPLRKVVISPIRGGSRAAGRRPKD